MADILTTTLAFFLVLILPGLPFAIVLSKHRSLYYVPILALGLSLAINSLILLAFTTLRVPFGRATLLGVYGIAAIAVALLLWKHFRSAFTEEQKSHPAWRWTAALLALSVAVFILRWLPLIPLPVMPGVDTSQHAAITALILENQAIPSGYEPFWEISSFTYHFGFHANAAAYSLISGLPPHETLTILGLVLLSFVPLSVFVLAVALSKSEHTAFIAAILTGAVSIFPAFYLNWGRLPQLAGVVVVILALALLIDYARSNPTRSMLLATGLLVGGLFLIHYRMFLFFLYGTVALLTARLVETRSPREVWKSFLRLAPIAVVAFVVTLPWLLTLLGSPLAEQLFMRDPAPAQAYSLSRIEAPLSYPSTSWLLALSLIGAGLAAVYRRVELTFLLTWSGLGLLLSNPLFVPGPLSGLLDTVTWASVMFVVQSILVAFIPIVGMILLKRRWRPPRGLYPAVVGAVVLLGMLGTGIVSNEGYETVRSQDLKAFSWIVENVPPEAVFITNMRVDPIIDTVQPVDAGIWITYFTGRKQLAPPILYTLERPPFPGYHEQLKQIADQEERIGSFDTYVFLSGLGVTHVYLGSTGTGPMNRQDLIASPWYSVLYQDGGVVIAELKDLSSL